MNKFIAVVALASGLSMSAAQAGGWGGHNGHTNASSGLVNVSPTINTGNITGISNVLNWSPILSGNSILSGNNAGIGVLGTGTGLLNTVIGSPNRSGGRKRR